MFCSALIIYVLVGVDVVSAFANDMLTFWMQAAKEARYDKEAVVKFFRMVCGFVQQNNFPFE